ncbi:MAG: adenylate/guanylate cyclase domain-containing protein [Rhodomicrobiaceae bacterium]
MRRKLTTIVAADVVGYSRLLSEDESGTLSAIEMLREKIVAPKAFAHSGRIFRFLGDGTLLEFDSALGAVEFAIEVQRSLAEQNAANPQQLPIILRIGINLGDTIFEGADIHGAGVNIAVRLETLSEPGGICLSDSVHAQIKHRIRANFVSIGPRRLKNILDPVHVWRWRPSTEPQAKDAMERLSDSAVFSGQHMLDPKVIDLLLRLHARSALLAVSNALDAIIDDEGNQVRSEQLFYHISEQLQEARVLLNVVMIERIDNFLDFTTSGAKYQTLGEFAANMFNDSKAGFAFKIIPQAQAIMASGQPAMVQRKLFMELVRRFHNEEFIVRSRKLIKHAYVD